MSELNQHLSLSSLINEANTFIDDIDIVTFDIFDTIFIRRIDNPDLVKIPVARHIEAKSKSLGIETFYVNNMRRRDEVENKWRAINGANGPDHEANYDVFMPEMLENIFGDALPENYFEELADYEIKIEDSVLVVREELLNWIKELHQKGKRLFLLSDIYLPAKYLKKLAKLKGIDHYFEDILSSADSLQAKASGAAFPLIKERFDLNKEKWLHIGDNPHSDGLMPLAFGIKSLVIKDYKEKHRRRLSHKYDNYSKRNPLWRGRYVLQTMMPLEAENKDQSPLYVDGHNYFGYLFGYFLHKLAEKCNLLNIEKIYFCSREGWLLQQCWDAATPYLYPNSEAPKSEYLYVSRMALAKAMCANTGLSMQVLKTIFLPAGNRTFNDICRVFDLKVDVFITYLEKHGLEPDTVISPHDNQDMSIFRKLEELVYDQEFQKVVKEQTQDHRDLYNEYLSDIGFFDNENIAFIDIGWLGTIQTFFCNSISHQTQKPNIHGFMLAATRYVEYEQTPKNYFEGLVYDGHKTDLSMALLENIRDIFEEITRSPDPTLVGFKRNEQGKVVPSLRQSDDHVGQNEKRQTEHYQPAQAGILAGVESYARSQELFGFTTSDLQPWLKLMTIQRIAYPTKGEVERLGIIEHIDDFGGKNPNGSNKLEGLSSTWGCNTLFLKIPFFKFLLHRIHIKSKSKFL